MSTVLGAYQLAASQEKIDKLMNPPSLRALAASQEKIDKLMNPPSLRALAVSQEKIDKLMNPPSLRALAASQTRLDKLFRVYSKVSMVDDKHTSQLLFDDLDAWESECVKNSLSEYLAQDEVVKSESGLEYKELESITQSNVNLRSIDIQHKSAFLKFIEDYLRPVLLGMISGYLMIVIQSNTEESLKEARDIREIKRIVRHLDDFTKTVLDEHRVVIGDGLRLRGEPSLKSEVIRKLAIGTVLEVLDSSNRIWLNVTLDIGGDEIEGWVSRRYTQSFKR